MKIATKTLEEGIKAVTSVTGSTEVQIICKGEFSVASSNEGRYARVMLDPKAKGKWRTRVLAGVLLEMIKRSAEVDLDMKDESTMNVKLKNTSGQIKTMPFEELPMLDHKKGSSIREKQQHEISDALSLVGISDIHEAVTANFVFIKMDKKGLTVSRFDEYHMAYFRNEDVKGKEKLDIVASIESFNVINQMAGKNSFKFSMSDSIQAWNDEFELQLPLVQFEAKQSLDSVVELMGSLKANRGEFEVDKEELFTALEKCAAVHETGKSVGVSSSGNSIELEIKTSFGQVKTKIKGKTKGKVSCRIDPNLVMDTLRPSKGKELRLKFTDNLAFCHVSDEARKSSYAFVLVK